MGEETANADTSDEDKAISNRIAVAIINAAERPLMCQKDKLAIVATADPTRGQAPYDDADYELWGLAVTGTYEDVKRLDVVFEMHPEGYYERDPNVLKRLRELKEPVYMLKKRDDIPTSMAYPMDMITSKYRAYHTSSISYILALAYHSYLTTGKPGRVELYGIHMGAKEEYQDQRPCCEYWMGRMEAAGIEVIPAEGGVLLVGGNGLYGIENYNPVCWDMRQRYYLLQNGVNHESGKIRAAEIQKAKNEGAIFELEFWLRKNQRGEYEHGRPEHDIQEEQKESGSSNPKEDGGAVRKADG